MSVPAAYERLVELVRRLAANTATGEIEWEPLVPNPVALARGRFPDTQEPTAFTHKAKTASVRILSRDGDNSPPHQFTILRDGQEIEQLTSEWWGEEGERAAPWNSLLADLYRAARSTALGIDKTIDELLQGLPEGRSEDDIPF
jgi:hypothetical protein